MQIIREPRVYDVCIVGSGAVGGIAAKVLTEAGAVWDTEKDSKMFACPYDSPGRYRDVGRSLLANSMAWLRSIAWEEENMFRKIFAAVSLLSVSAAIAVAQF